MTAYRPRLVVCRWCGVVFVEGAPAITEDRDCIILGERAIRSHRVVALAELATDPPGWARKKNRQPETCENGGEG